MVRRMAKRKLPVLNASPEDDQEPRPPWHWVGFGAVLVFASWMPLALLAQSIASRLSVLPPSDSPAEAASHFWALDPAARAHQIATMAIPHALALAMAAFAAGYVVGRFGDRTGTREAAIAGFAAALVAVLLALASAGISWPPFVVLVWTPAWCALGGRTGVRARAMR